MSVIWNINPVKLGSIVSLNTKACTHFYLRLYWNLNMFIASVCKRMAKANFFNDSNAFEMDLVVLILWLYAHVFSLLAHLLANICIVIFAKMDKEERSRRRNYQYLPSLIHPCKHVNMGGKKIENETEQETINSDIIHDRTDWGKN